MSFSTCPSTTSSTRSRGKDRAGRRLGSGDRRRDGGRPRRRWSRVLRRTTGREAGGAIGQADTFRARVAPLVQADADVYSDAHDASPPARGGCGALPRPDDCGTRSSRPPRSRSRSPRRAPTWPASPHCSSRTGTRRSGPMPRSRACSPREGRPPPRSSSRRTSGATEDDPRVRHVRTLVGVAAEASERALAAAE